MAIDYKMFFDKMVEYFQENNLTNISAVNKQSCNDRNSCWGKITEAMIGKFDRRFSLQLFSAWKKNNRKIQNKLKKTINNNEKKYNTKKNEDSDSLNSLDSIVDSVKEVEKNQYSFITKIEKTNKLLLKFTSEEWKNMQAMLSGKRPSFKVEFTNNLSLRLQRAGVKCWLKNIYNHITTCTVRQCSFYWKGLYKCINPNCNARFKAFIQDKPINGGSIIVNWSKGSSHEKLKKPSRLTGEERGKTSKNIMIHGTNFVRNENIIHNVRGLTELQMEKVINENVMRVAKHQYKHVNRLSNDIFIDAQATKSFYNTPLVNKSSVILKGYIHDIRQDNFGILLYCEKQFKIWQSILKVCPFWFFDGTGGILKSVKKQSKVLLYSLVMHDREKKLICPVAEFFTTGHDTQTIKSYLDLIKNAIEKTISKNSFQIAPIIVTDFSWAIINAACYSFNQCSIDGYIAWCYDILINKKIWLFNSIQTILVLCYSHFIKLVSKKIKKIKKYNDKGNNNKLREIALYTCSTLQKSSSIDEFNENIKHAFNIFNVKENCKEKKASFFAIKNKIGKSIMSNDISKIEQTESNKKSILYVSNSQHINLRKNSQFTEYYEKLLKRHRLNLNTKKFKCKAELNPYYCPKIFQILIHYIHLMPLWSGVMLSFWCKINPQINELMNRITNNPVENWFGQIKNALDLFLPAMPSEYSNVVYTLIDAIYELHPEFKLIHLNNYKNKNNDAKEAWSKSKIVPRKKGYFNTISDTKDPFDDLFKDDLKKRKPAKIQNKRQKHQGSKQIEGYDNTNAYESTAFEDLNFSVDGKSTDSDDNSEFRSHNNQLNEAQDNLADSNDKDYGKKAFIKKQSDKAINYDDNSISIIKNDNMIITDYESDFTNVSNYLSSGEDDNEIYFLKLVNNKNSCFANSVVQLLLSCGNTLFNEVITELESFKLRKTKDQSEPDDSFASIFNFYINQYKLRSKGCYDTMNLRKFLDKKNHILTYSKNNQNDSFNFLCDLIQHSEMQIQQMFFFKEIIAKTCSECDNKKTKNKETCFISLCRDRKGKKSFKNLFETSRHDDIYCEKCKKNTKHSENINYKLDTNTQYLIIRINLSMVAYDKVHRYKMKIDDFDPDSVKIPGINETFMLKSTIIHEEIHDPNHPTAGHYTCQVKLSNTWFLLSDMNCTKRNLNKYLNDSFILLLEKK